MKKTKRQCPKCKTWDATMSSKVEMFPHLDPPRRTVTRLICDNCRHIIAVS